MDRLLDPMMSALKSGKLSSGYNYWDDLNGITFRYTPTPKPSFITWYAGVPVSLKALYKLDKIVVIK